MTLHHFSARSGLRAFRAASWPRQSHERSMTVREPESRCWPADLESGQWPAEPESGQWPAEPEPGGQPAEPELGRQSESLPALTVVVLGEPETRWGIGAVVSRVAELAVDDELLVVYESERRYDPDNCPVVSRLRDYLPRHHVIAVPIARAHQRLYPQDAALVEYFVESGSLPVVVTPAAAGHDIAAELASMLHADRVVRVSRTVDGVKVCEVWQRTPADADR